MKWIKLTDQKPPERTNVVFWNEKTMTPVAGYWANNKANYLQSWIIRPVGETLPWDLNGSLMPVFESGCTHWIPLPSFDE